MRARWRYVSENSLHKAIYTLEKISMKFGLTISIGKTKTIAFRGQKPITSKIVINNKIIQQINIFKYTKYRRSRRGLETVTTPALKFPHPSH